LIKNEARNEDFMDRLTPQQQSIIEAGVITVLEERNV
jgi:hypothetical protein